MGKFGKELIESLSQAAVHAEGRRVKRVRVTKVKTPNMKAIPAPRDADNPVQPSSPANGAGLWPAR